MKFPKSSVLLCCFSLIFFSCKKEVNEKKSLQIIQNVVEKKITKEKFKDEVLPEIKSLYEKDSVKYRILNHIAKKAAAEKNPKIFSMQLNDMKSEMKYVK